MFGFLQGAGDTIRYVGDHPVDLGVVVVDAFEDFFGFGVDLIDSTGDDYKVRVVGCRGVGPSSDGVSVLVEVEAAGGTFILITVHLLVFAASFAEAVFQE